MRSMTGYGRGEAQVGGARITLELRSLNHRFLEVRVRTSSELVDHAFFLEQGCRELFTRGRYDVSARYEGSGVEDLQLDSERLRRLHAVLSGLNQELSPNSPLPLSAVLSVPGVFSTVLKLDPEVVKNGLDRALRAAREALDRMRDAEGRALGDDLQGRLQAVQSLRERIAAQSDTLLVLHKNRLQERMAKLLAGTQIHVDPQRLEVELALLAERSDVTEELVRLASHFEQFSALLAATEPVGRRLDFLLQEIGRETNTIGSKCQEASLSHLIVELKSEVERMREQVQNVE